MAALLRNLYELAEVIPTQDGPPEGVPILQIVLFDALLSVWRSARQGEAELAHPLVWGFIRRIVAERFLRRPRHTTPQEPHATTPLPPI